MQLEEILSELENNTGTFPRLALERAIEEREAITPVLLATLEECKNNLEEFFDKDAYMLHIYALNLLAQFRETKAYPLIIEFFSIPGDMPSDITGDVVTEDLARILASVYDGNIEPIKQLIENTELNEYVRDAAIQSLVVLMLQGIITREEVIKYYEELFVSKLKNEPEDSYVWTHLVNNSADICPIELKEYIDRAFENDLIDLWYISQENVNDAIQIGVEAALDKLRNNQRYSLIDNTISEMEHWACFRPKTPDKKYNLPILSEGFNPSVKQNKGKADKKKKMQKESRRKNRTKKK